MGIPLPFACACEERLGLSLAEFAALVGKTALLFDETRFYHRGAGAVTSLGHAVAALRRLWHRLETPLWKYRLGVAGLSAADNAALLHSLLHCTLPCRRAGPWADVPFEFHYGDAWSLSLYHAAGPARSVLRCADGTDVGIRLEQVADGNPGMDRRLEKVVVQAPAPLLRRGLVLCDMPVGRSSAPSRAETPASYYLESFSRTDVAHVVWVAAADDIAITAATGPAGQSCVDCCSDVIVTGCGELDEPAAAGTGRIAVSPYDILDYFGCRSPAVIFVPPCNGNAEAAVVRTARERISEMADPEARIQDIAAAWERVGDSVRDWCIRREREEGAATFRWRPDSWVRWLGVAAATSLGQAMAERLSSLDETCREKFHRI
ncbi:MAG: hypothetical protein LIQ31_13745 [Planctomycetes bacterium]|nr:hypothetical protein [Planctomycetota bacterium]